MAAKRHCGRHICPSCGPREADTDDLGEVIATFRLDLWRSLTPAQRAWIAAMGEVRQDAAPAQSGEAE